MIVRNYIFSSITRWASPTPIFCNLKICHRFTEDDRISVTKHLWVFLSLIWSRDVYYFPYSGNFSSTHLADSYSLCIPQRVGEWESESEWEVGEERDYVGEGALPCSLLACSCRFPRMLYEWADAAENRSPSPAVLWDLLFTEGRICLEPPLGKWRAGTEGRIFLVCHGNWREMNLNSWEGDIVSKKAMK